MRISNIKYASLRDDKSLSMDAPTTQNHSIEGIQSVEAFLADQKQSWSKETIRKCKSNLNRFLLFLTLDQVNIEGLDHSHIQKFFVDLAKKNIRQETLAQYKRHIRLYLEWCYKARPEIKAEIIPFFEGSKSSKSLARDPAAVQMSESSLNPLPPEVDQRIQMALHSSTDPRHSALLLIRKTGLTLGEVLSVRCDRVGRDDRNRYFITVLNPRGRSGEGKRVWIDEETYRWIASNHHPTTQKLHYRDLQAALTQICREHCIQVPVTLKSLQDTHEYLRVSPTAIQDLYRKGLHHDSKMASSDFSLDENAKKAA